jgi:hypothetical protein
MNSPIEILDARQTWTSFPSKDRETGEPILKDGEPVMQFLHNGWEFQAKWAGAFVTVKVRKNYFKCPITGKDARDAAGKRIPIPHKVEYAMRQTVEKREVWGGNPRTVVVEHPPVVARLDQLNGRIRDAVERGIYLAELAAQEKRESGRKGGLTGRDKLALAAAR